MTVVTNSLVKVCALVISQLVCYVRLFTVTCCGVKWSKNREAGYVCSTEFHVLLLSLDPYTA